MTKMIIYHDIIVMVLLMSGLVIMTFVTIIENSVFAQDDGIFGVNIGVFGVNNSDSTDDLAASFVTVNDTTKSRLINTTELDSEDSNGQDGIIESVSFYFPNTTVNLGEEFRACFFIFQTLNAFCDTGYNSPLNRTEFAAILIQEDREQE
jgi:hypothetical protein